MKKAVVLKIIFSICAGSLVVFAFQNCSPARFNTKSISEDSASLDPSANGQGEPTPLGQDPEPTCTFNAQTVSEGAGVNAFQNSTVPAGSSCQSETRTCTSGALSGSFAYSTCAPAVPASCLFNGQTVAHNQSVTAYANSTVMTGQSCSDAGQSETRTCTNGQLSGTFNFSTCNVNAPAACLFNGQTVAHAQSVVAYLTSTVPAGQSCQVAGQSETRVCNDGRLSGTFNYSSCAPAAQASCLFNGQTVANGQGVIAYANSTVPAGQNCASAQNSEVRVCNNGALTGTFNYASCAPAAASSCMFNGQTVANGQAVIGYATSTVPFGESCSGAGKSEARVCTNGTLSGTFAFLNCSPGAAASCMFNNMNVAHGQSVTAYSSATSGNEQTCQSISQSRTCNNGTLSGTYTFSSCTSGNSNTASCMFNGQTIAHGQSVTGYLSSSVPFGQSCNTPTQSESRTCNNGTLSGTFAYSSCSANAAASCNFNGQSYSNGQSVTAYAALTVPFGQTCQSQSRTCSNGTFSGTYNYAACTVGAGATCNFNGQTISHGQSVTAYSSSNVPYGQSCSSATYRQTRTCNNGTLSGSYTQSSCTVGSPVSCNFNGQTVPHGSSVVAYVNSSVSYGQSCQSENRACSNGALSGSNAFSSCTVAAKPAYCEDSFTKDMCDIYQYLYGRWPDQAGAQYWTNDFQNRGIPRACWHRQILYGTQSVDCEPYRLKWGGYPYTNGVGACANLIPPPGSTGPIDAPLAAATAQCP